MIQSIVYIKKETHQYFDSVGTQYTSVSKVLDGIEEKFDPNIAYHVAGKGKYAGMTPQQVLKAWDKNRDKAADHGTRIHDAIENYTKYFKIEEGNEDLEAMLKAITREYIDYKTTHAEAILFSPRLAALGTYVAGTTDRVLIPKPKGYFDVEDYKTNISKGIYYHSDKNKYFYSPVDHLSHCNFNRYALQMSIYAIMVEELTGMKCRKMWLTFIPEDNPLDYRKIPVNFLKTDALAVLNAFHEKNISKPTIILPHASNYSEEVMPTF